MIKALIDAGAELNREASSLSRAFASVPDFRKNSMTAGFLLNEA
mgnify:CR=1 FL=1